MRLQAIAANDFSIKVMAKRLLIKKNLLSSLHQCQLFQGVI